MTQGIGLGRIMAPQRRHDALASVTADQHHAQAHGASEHTDITREVWLPASATVIAGAEQENYAQWGGVNGGANADEPHVLFTMKVPDDFASFTKVEAVFIHEGSGDIYWHITASYAASGQDRVTHTDTPAIAAQASGATRLIEVQEPANALALANLASGDYLGLDYTREGTNVADTLDQQMLLLGLLFTYVANQ
tara:strand:- start:326 stop:910 length:585 start_codon:yes stop_codon:yes gene_type:complete